VLELDARLKGPEEGGHPDLRDNACRRGYMPRGDGVRTESGFLLFSSRVPIGNLARSACTERQRMGESRQDVLDIANQQSGKSLFLVSADKVRLARLEEHARRDPAERRQTVSALAGE
jgi:hypothetical protein